MATLKAKAQKILTEKTNKLKPEALKYGKKAFGMVGSLINPVNPVRNEGAVFDDTFHKLYLQHYGDEVYVATSNNKWDNIADFGKITFYPDEFTGKLISNAVNHKNIWNSANYDMEDEEFNDQKMPNMGMLLSISQPNGYFINNMNYCWKFGLTTRTPYINTLLVCNDPEDAVLNLIVVFMYPKSEICFIDNENFIAGMYLDDTIIDRVKLKFTGVESSNIDDVYNGAGFYLVEASTIVNETQEGVSVNYNYDFKRKITEEYDVPFNHFYVFGFVDGPVEIMEDTVSAITDCIQDRSTDNSDVYNIVETSYGQNSFEGRYWDVVNNLLYLSFGDMATSFEPYRVEPLSETWFYLVTVSNYTIEAFENPDKFRIHIKVFDGFDEEGYEIYRDIGPILLSEFIKQPVVDGNSEIVAFAIDLAPYGVVHATDVLNFVDEESGTSYLIEVEKYNDSTGDWEILDTPSDRFRPDNLSYAFGTNKLFYGVNDASVN